MVANAKATTEPQRNIAVTVDTPGRPDDLEMHRLAQNASQQGEALEEKTIFLIRCLIERAH